MTAPRRLVVVSAGLSQPSSTRLLADRLSAATARVLREAAVETDVEVVELRDHAHAVTDNLVAGFPSAELADTIDGLARADGVIVVSPIFNASYSGLFKSFFDVLERDALAGKPVLIAATGGTARHSLVLEHALRPLFSYLQAVVVPTAVYAASEDWGTKTGERVALAGRIDRAAHQLAALMQTTDAAAPDDPFDVPVPFEDLLAGNRPDNNRLR